MVSRVVRLAAVDMPTLCFDGAELERFLSNAGTTDGVINPAILMSGASSLDPVVRRALRPHLDGAAVATLRQFVDLWQTLRSAVCSAVDVRTRVCCAHPGRPGRP